MEFQKNNIIDFLNIALQIKPGKGLNGVSLKSIPKSFMELDVEASVGKGRATVIPWVAFLGYGQDVTNGIFPVVLYYYNYKKLLVAYGISATETPNSLWSISGAQTVGQYFSNIGIQPSSVEKKYEGSFVHSVYDVPVTNNQVDSNKFKLDEVFSAITAVCETYKTQFSQNETVRINQSILNVSAPPLHQISYNPAPSMYTQYITAIKTKPFVLLAGISGTGKSRIVRQLARACDTLDAAPWDVPVPQNFQMIQVQPDWHDGSELLGYESRISGQPEYVVKDFLKFIVRAWIHENVPFFLCLDEMNLAPVEQYFAQYLSVVETRHLNKNGVIESDPIIKLEKKYCDQLADMLYPQSDSDEDGANRAKLKEKFKNMKYEIPLPKNLIVMGTVNMDETTFGFSRKVLDRAMTIEMNEVDLAGGLEDTDKERFGIAAADILPTAVEGKDVYAENKELCDKVIGYLQQVNDVLEDTPFKIAYRTRNEFLVYAVNRGEDNLTESLDEMTSMKILSRIEGDQDKVGHVLEGLEQVMKDNGLAEEGLSLKKVKSMTQRLKSGYTSYWS